MSVPSAGWGVAVLQIRARPDGSWTWGVCPDASDTPCALSFTRHRTAVSAENAARAAQELATASPDRLAVTRGGTGSYGWSLRDDSGRCLVLCVGYHPTDRDAEQCARWLLTAQAVVHRVGGAGAHPVLTEIAGSVP